MGLTGYYDTRDSTKPAFDAGLKMNKVDIPSAFQALTTVQMLAPIAKYASGNVSTDLHVNGALGKNMMPLLAGLTGAGQLQTSILKLNDFPGMQKIADVTGLSALNNPTFEAIKAAFDIQNGRLAVKPFNVKVAGMTMSVAGSNGLDQTIQYTLGLKVPRSLLGTGANQAIAGLASNAQHPARRSRDQSNGEAGSRQRHDVGGEGCRAGGDAEDVGGSAEAGAGGTGSGDQDPAGGPGAGRQGEEDGVRPGRFAGGQGGEQHGGADSRQAGGRSDQEADGQQSGCHRE
jgi:hypothetical protein